MSSPEIPGTDSTPVSDTGRHVLISSKKRTNRNLARRTKSLAPQIREKATRVRRIRACLCCKVLKIPCSGAADRPCDACLAQVSKKLQWNALPWRYCIRTTFRDVNIFNVGPSSHAAPPAPPQTSHWQLEMDASYLRDGALDLPTIDAAVQAAIRWLTAPTAADEQAADSPQVLIESCSTTGLIGATKAVAFGPLFDHARALLYMLSLSRNSSGTSDAAAGDDDDDDCLRAVGYAEGRQVLHGLDALFAPKYLAALDRTGLQVLFMLVLGSALAVSYAGQDEASPEFPGEVHFAGGASEEEEEQEEQGQRRPPTLWQVMRQHVWEMMSHYLIILGSRTGCRIPTRHHRDMITGAVDKWRRAGRVPWVQGPAPPGLAAGLGAA